MAEETPNPAVAQLQAALSAPIGRLYANGFVVAQTASDLMVLLLSNGAPSAFLNLSYISARTLIEELSKAVGDFEKATGQKIPTIGEVAQNLEKQKGAPNVGA